MSKHTGDQANDSQDPVRDPAHDATQERESAGKSGRSDLRAFDLTAFIRAKREMRGTVRLGELGRMVTEVPDDAPDGAMDELLEWHAQGESRREVRQSGFDPQAPNSRVSQKALSANTHTVSQPYLLLKVKGRAWLECQRCMRAFEFPIDIETNFRVMDSEAEADAVALDEDEAEVIVGSDSFDFYDLIDEEVVLTLPMVPKHDVCPTVHAAVVSGTDGSLGVESVEDIEARLIAADAVDAEDVVLPGEKPLDATTEAEAEALPASPSLALTRDGRPKPFAALEGLRKRLSAGDDEDGTGNATGGKGRKKQ